MGVIRAELTLLGAPARLLMSGELQAVLPVEEAKLLDATNPVQTDGSVLFDTGAIKRRENAMVRILLDAAPVTVVVLGGGHDLSNTVTIAFQET